MKSKKIWLWAIPMALLLCVMLLAQQNLFSSSNKEEAPSDAPRSSYDFPHDLANSATEREAAEFAWETFIAMNWPAAKRAGEPDKQKVLGDKGPTVWETWMEVFDLFADPSHPPKWGAENFAPNVCDGKSAAKVLHQSTKVSDLLDERDQAVGGALVDVNGNIARYEVRVNEAMFQFIVDNQLYNKQGQAIMPEAKFKFPNGSIELKAAWKQMEKGVDDFSRFHTATTLIYDKDIDNIGVNTDCLPASVRKNMRKCDTVTMGLVGLHIVYRVPSAPSSVWITFEQVDNTNDTPKGAKASFYDKKCKDCLPNKRFCDVPGQQFTQVERVVLNEPSITKSDEVYKAVNTERQNSKLIKGTKWQYYKLVGVQYPTDPTFDRVGKPNRRQLANTTMETYNQSASSCVGCHAFARSSNPAFLSDFSWFMARAQIDSNFRLGPNSTAEEIMFYVSYVKPYKLWRTWPDDQWNKFSNVMGGENPHGKSVRIYVNDIAYNHVFDSNGKMKSDHKRRLPVGSIILKENFRVPFPIPATPSDLVEITLMYKQKGQSGPTDDPENWNWIKSAPNGVRIDNQGADESCFSCHSWKGNGDFMLSFNFGDEPVIQTNRTDQLLAKQFAKEKDLSPSEVELMQKFFSDQEKVQQLMREKMSDK